LIFYRIVEGLILTIIYIEYFYIYQKSFSAIHEVFLLIILISQSTSSPQISIFFIENYSYSAKQILLKINVGLLFPLVKSWFIHNAKIYPHIPNPKPFSSMNYIFEFYIPDH